MVIASASSIERGACIEAGTCIVGAGPAGLAVALGLRAAGHDVVVLESGGLAPTRRAQGLSDGAVVGLRGFPLAHSQVRGLGGSTAFWGGQCTPLTASDLAGRPDRPETVWPLGPADLAPWYAAAARFCRLRAAAPFDEAADTVADGALEVARFAFAWPRDLGRVHAADLGGCARVRVVTHATCTAILTEGQGRRVRALSVRRPDGEAFSVRARRVVLATGGIETPRLLLASVTEEAGGVGNRHDVVGRYYADHPYLMPGHLVAASAATARDPLVIRSFKRAGSEQRGHAGLALSAALRRREALNGAVAYFINRLPSETHADHYSEAGRAWAELADARRYRTLGPASLGRAGARIARRPLPLVRGLARRAREMATPRRLLALRTVLDTTPRRDSRVTLGGDRDALGQRRPRLDWRVDADDLRAHDRLLGLVAAHTAACGLGTLVVDPDRDADGWPVSFQGGRHHTGTTRMHADPRLGVVDADCRVHGVANLYIAGSSVFTTPGYANPTLSVVALALRLADRLAAEPAP